MYSHSSELKKDAIQTLLKKGPPDLRNGQLHDASEADHEKREDLMIQQLANWKGVAVIILGRALDLSDNVPEGVKLIELTVKGYSEAVGESATRE